MCNRAKLNGAEALTYTDGHKTNRE